MKKNILLFVLTVLFLFLDTAFFSAINLYGIRPYLVLALALSATITFSVQSGIVITAVSGLIIDLITNPYIGLTSALYLAAVILVYVFTRRGNHKKIYVLLIITAVLVALNMLLWLLSTIFGSSVNILNALLLHSIPCAVVTGAVAMLLIRAMRPLLKGQLESA